MGHNNIIASVEESKNIKYNNGCNVYTSHQDSCNTINNKSSKYDDKNLISDTKCKEVVYRDIDKTKSNIMHVKRKVELQSEKCERTEEMQQEQKLLEEEREEECVEVELEREMQRAEQIAEAKLLEDINELWCEMYYDNKKLKHHKSHEEQQQEQQRYLGKTIAASNVGSNEGMYKLLPVTKSLSLLHTNDRNVLNTKGSANANYKEHNNECEKVECMNNIENITHDVSDLYHYNDSNANNYYTSASKVEKVNELDNINKSEIFTLLSPSQGEFNVELQKEEYYQCLEDKIECDDKELSVFDTLVTSTTSRKPASAALFSISKTLHNSSSCKMSNTINSDDNERDDNLVINLPAAVVVTSLCIATTQKSNHTEITSFPAILVEQKECQEDNIANEVKDSNTIVTNSSDCSSGEDANNFEKVWYVCHDRQTTLEELESENMNTNTETCYQEELLQEELQTSCNEYINNDLETCNTRTEKISSLIVEGDALEQEEMITKCLVSRDMISNDSINSCTNALNDTNNSNNVIREEEEQSSAFVETSNTNEEKQVKLKANTNCFVNNDMFSKEELTKTFQGEQIISETTNSNDNNNDNNNDSVEESQEQSVCKTKVVTPNNINIDEVDTKESDNTHLDDKDINAVICDNNEIPHNSNYEDSKLLEEEQEMNENSQEYKLYYPYFYWCYHDNEGDSNNTFTMQDKCHYDSNSFCSDNSCICESTSLTEYAQEDNAHYTSCQPTSRFVNSKCKGNDHHHYYDDCCCSGYSLCHGKPHTHLTRHVLVPPLDLSCLYIPNNEVLMEMYNNATSSKLLEASSSLLSPSASPSLSLLPTLVEVQEEEADSNNYGDIISNNIINSCMPHSYCKNVTCDQECIDNKDTNNNSSNISENINIDNNMANEKSINAASAGHHSKIVIAANSNAIKTHSASCENASTCEHDAKWTNYSKCCSLTLGKKVVFRDESDALDDMHRNATRVNECHQLFRIEFLLLCSHEQRVRRQIAQD